MLEFYIKTAILLILGDAGFRSLSPWVNYSHFFNIYAVAIVAFVAVQHFTERKTRNLTILFFLTLALNPLSGLGIINFIGTLFGGISGESMMPMIAFYVGVLTLVIYFIASSVVFTADYLFLKFKIAKWLKIIIAVLLSFALVLLLVSVEKSKKKVEPFVSGQMTSLGISQDVSAIMMNTAASSEEKLAGLENLYSRCQYEIINALDRQMSCQRNVYEGAMSVGVENRTKERNIAIPALVCDNAHVATIRAYFDAHPAEGFGPLTTKEFCYKQVSF